MSRLLDRSDLKEGEKLVDAKGHAYEIVKKLGEGRCAVVYEVVEVASAARVAIKVYNSGVRYEGALQRELTVLSTLESMKEKTNTVLSYGHFRTTSNQCIILELLGSNVRQILYRNNKKGLSLWGIQKFAKDIFRGLQALHSQGLVHADLKPANIHWSPSDATYKIIDFGLSFHLSEKDIHQVQSMGYQSPEVQLWNDYKARQKKHIQDANENHDRKRSLRLDEVKSKSLLCLSQAKPNHPCCAIDVWSVGCLMMEVAAGGKFLKDCYLAANVNQSEIVIHKLVDDVLTKITKDHAGKNKNFRTDEYFEDLKDLIHRSLAFDPKCRITCKDALNHPFLKQAFEPTASDYILLSMQPFTWRHLINSSNSENSMKANGKQH